MGGDCFAMVWDPTLEKVIGLVGSGGSPRALTLDIARSRAKNGTLPPTGAVTVSVPGAVDAWWTLHQRYGTLKWAELFEPVIHYATQGVPVPDIISTEIASNMKAFLRPGSVVEETANALHTFAPNGETPGVGKIFRNPDLARTCRMIAEGGRDAFYEGPIARTIEAYFKRIGWMTAPTSMRRASARSRRSSLASPRETACRGSPSA
jgi:gamma-glutamyltranspeptidase / glutathione hydrolase